MTFSDFLSIVRGMLMLFVRLAVLMLVIMITFVPLSLIGERLGLGTYTEIREWLVMALLVAGYFGIEFFMWLVWPRKKA